MKKKISSFTYKDGEKIFSYGGRFKDFISICPYHGFGTWMMVPYFYEGMLPQMKKIVETICGGDSMSKILDEEIQFLEYVANVSKEWEDPIPNWESIRTQNPTQSSSRGGIYNITQDLELQSTISSLARMLEELETMIKVCAMCESKEYVTIKSLTISIVKIEPLKA